MKRLWKFLSAFLLLAFAASDIGAQTTGQVLEPGGGGKVIPRLVINLGTNPGGNGPYVAGVFLTDQNGNPISSSNPLNVTGGGGGGGNVTIALGTAGGWTPKVLNALSTTVTPVKSSAGQLGMLQCYNPNSTQAYVQLFNGASGSVTLGSTGPALSVAIAPTATGGWALSNPGVQFSTAISVAATTTATGSTAPSTAVDCNVVYN